MIPLLTWSGDASHEVARFFREWLPTVVPGVSPWVSSEDIAKGRHWFDELESQLDKTSLSITFITPQNVRSPWVYYEVGFVAAKLKRGRVCPFLIGVDDRAVKDTPLGQYQWTKFDREDVLKLIRAINEELGQSKQDPMLIESVFRLQWPKLKRQIDKAAESFDETVYESISEVDPTVEEQLSREAKEILSEMAKSDLARLVYFRHMGCSSLVAGEKHFLDEEVEASPRLEATLRHAIAELEGFELIEDVGNTPGQLFEITKSGYDVADNLARRAQ